MDSIIMLREIKAALEQMADKLNTLREAGISVQYGIGFNMETQRLELMGFQAVQAINLDKSTMQ